MLKSDSYHSSYQVSKPKDGTRSINRAISLLRAVADYNEQGAQLSKISRKVGFHIATTRRILSALADEGILFYDPMKKLYTLGYELYSLGTKAYQFNLKDQMNGVLQQIVEETHDSVFLLMRSGLDVICISNMHGSYPVRVSATEVGTRRPLGIGAASIAILANLPEDQMDYIIFANKPRYETYNNFNSDKVKHLVSIAKKLGYSLFDKQIALEYTAVALPIFSHKNEVVAAITVSSIPSRMNPKRRKQVIKIMKSKIAGIKLV
jgi:DNA-binding IclR family transcriptional regulator